MNSFVLCADVVPEYNLPYSKEVGERANPSLDAMRAIVVHGRKRPKIPESWKTHEVHDTNCNMLYLSNAWWHFCNTYGTTVVNHLYGTL